MRMCKAILILGLSGLVACSSVKKTGDEKTDALLAHLSQDTRVIGKNFDEKFTRSGLIGNEFVAIGSATSEDLDYMIRPLRVRAEADATAQLLKSAPSEFKKVVMAAIDTANGDEGSVQESQVQITEVKALTGMKSNFDDTQCVKTASPNKQMGWNFKKECRVILRVASSELLKAFKFTLQSKYGIKQQNEIQKILLEELSKPTKQEVPKNAPVQAQANQ